MSFTGKVVLVTGAGAGIGRALGAAYAREGATVVLNDVDADRVGQAASELGVESHPCDVADVGAVRAMVGSIIRRHGHVDVAVANAGVTLFGEFLDYEPAAFDRVVDVNLRGSFFTAQAAARSMVSAGVRGRIVLVSSVAGVSAIRGLSAYGTTKAGLQMMARTLALELGPHGITVNAVAPGATVTERTRHERPLYEQDWADVTPNRRAGHLDDVVGAVLYLTSPEARHITGQTLVVDGGWTATSEVPEGY